MAHHVISASVQGIEASKVEVQIDSAPGIHALSIVGLADKAVQESQDRINAAVRNSGLVPPETKNRRFTVNLAPANTRKEGAAFDLPIATAYLVESRQLAQSPEKTLLAGELSLDGSLAPVNGILAIASLAKKNGHTDVIVSHENAKEAAFVDGISVYGARTLREVFEHLNGTQRLVRTTKETDVSRETPKDDSFAYIQGQFAAKRALTIAAAGRHNLLMKGPPGSGKTLLARAMRGLLPPLSEQEAMEVAKIYSSVGLLRGSPASMVRPFRSPHHTSSSASIVGGGTWPKPGEISLAHRGVLFLDEFPEFARNVLESLRQPLEDGVVTISRASGSLELPACFLLVAAMNPCPCGNHGDPRTTCVCPPTQVVRYAKKVSGPLLDRMDIQIAVPRETIKNHSNNKDSDSFDAARNAVLQARAVQSERFRGMDTLTNSGVSHKNIGRLCPMDASAAKLLEEVVNRKNLSQRGLQKIQKVAQTISDIEGAEFIQEHHIAEAAALRISEQVGV